MSASPSLHLAIHTDADQTEHHCAVTLHSKGAIELPPMFAALRPVFLRQTEYILAEAPRSAVPPGLCWERGPPSLPD